MHAWILELVMQTSGPWDRRRARIQARYALCWFRTQVAGLMPGSEERIVFVNSGNQSKHKYHY